MVEMISRSYDRFTNPARGHEDGPGGRLRARLDVELVRLVGELRALDSAIAAARLVVQQYQRDPDQTTRRDEARRQLRQLMTNRGRLVDATVVRMHEHAADVRGLWGNDACRAVRRPRFGAEVSSLEVDLGDYLGRVAALAASPRVVPEG